MDRAEEGLTVEILPTDALVRLRTADGRETLLRVPGEHLQRVLDLANTHYGDTAKVIGGPRLTKEK